MPPSLTSADRDVVSDAGLALHDRRFDVGGGIVKLDRHESLFGARLQILEHTLIAGIVGNHEEEIVGGLDGLPFFLNRQQPAIVAERMNDDRRILTRFDHLIEIDDRAVLDAQRERSVHPDRFLSFEQIPADQIRRRQDLRGTPR